MDAPILRMVLQRHPRDCGVAVLAMLCGVSYEEALVAVSAEAPMVLTHGLTTQQLVGAARRLGYRLRRTKRYDVETDTGALCVQNPRWPTDHLVVLAEDRIIETDGLLWEPDTFFKHYHAKPGVLFVAEALEG